LNPFHVSSVLIRLIALVWAVGMAGRYRDWRFGALAALLALLLVNPVRAVVVGDAVSPVFGIEGLWGLVISFFALGAVFLLDRVVAEQQRASDSLEHSHRILQLVMDTIPQRLFWKDRNYRYIGCNKAAAEDAGLDSPEDIVGKTDFELAWRQSAHIYRTDDEAVIAENRSKVGYEEPQVRDDGTELWLRTTKVPLRNEMGEVIGVFGSYEDITERKRAEQELRRSEERYRTLVEQASDGIFVTDQEGNFVDVNSSACAMVGYSRSELLSMHMRDLVRPEDIAEQPLRFPELRAGKHTVTERRLKRKDGELVPVEISAKMLPDGRIQGIARDISERKRAEEERERLEAQLRQAQKMETVGQLAGGIAHDFNNLLTAIQGHAELLMQDADVPERWIGDLEEIRKASRRGASLTQQLLAFSRRQVLVPRTLDLNAVVSDLENMLRRLVGPTLQLEIQRDPDLGLVRADPSQVEQVVMNLVVNARDAMPRGGSVVIETRNAEFDAAFVETHPGAQPGSYVALCVRDGGRGMDAATLERAFEPFFTTKGPGEGSGLGLSMVYGIVKQSGGYVWLSSEPGAGTECTVYLPRVSGAVEVEQEARASPASSHGWETVLVVEDTEQVRRLAGRVLRERGYTVLSTADPEEALEMAEAHDGPIHLLMADLVLPKMSGRELGERLRAHRPEIRVLYMSGYTQETVFQRGLLGRDVVFLQKPFSIEALLAKVSQILSGG